MTTVDPEIWADMLAYLRKNHGDKCRRWFNELRPKTMSGGLFEIEADDDPQLSYLRRNCQDSFTEAARSVTGALVVVRFVAKDELAAKPMKLPAIADSNAEDMILSPDYTFDTFVTGPANRLAYSASCAVANKPGDTYNPLFVHGGSGLGKTHLLQAICQNQLRENPNAKIVYLNCDSFISLFMHSVQNGNMADFRNQFRHVDLILIDDIHFLRRRERTQEEFFHTFNTLYQANKQIVLSADAAPEEIPELEERLVSRFQWGLVTRLDRPCFETRVAIIQAKAQLRGIAMPNDVAAYIAQKHDSNIRELEGAVTKVQSMASVANCDINLDIAQEAFGLEGHMTDFARVTVPRIMQTVTRFYGVKTTEVCSKRRHKSITQPRQVCMYLIRKHTDYSLKEIGNYFGGRDHTTVMHAIKTVQKRLEGEAEFPSQMELIEKRLLSPDG